MMGWSAENRIIKASICLIESPILSTWVMATEPGKAFADGTMTIMKIIHSYAHCFILVAYLSRKIVARAIARYQTILTCQTGAFRPEL